jgi:cyclic beta-1,2-glucan synthetase
VEEPAGLAAALAEVSESLLPHLETLVVTLVVTAPAHIEPALVRELRIWLAALREDLVLWQKEVDALAPWLGLLARPPALYRHRDFGAGAAWHALRTAVPGRPPLGRAPKACRRARKRLAQLEAAVEKEAETAAGPRPDAGGGAVSGAGAARIPAAVFEEARVWNAALAESLELGIRNNETLLADLREVSAVAERLVAEMDFDFLFDRRRCLFHIGYDATAGTPDPNYYDLLASEARLASFVAIAKGNVPPAHWLHLGRPFARVDGTRALLSWGGTMFEYLMPSLLMRHPGATLLGLSCRAAVDRQIAHGEEVEAPWGVSESGFAELDPRANYRYAAFGVPGLGLKRDLGRRLVVSPYASLLALPFRARAVEKNIAALERLGMLGRYGLFEALDLGRAELPREPRIVQSYMTHHQGMILLALVNALRDGTMVARFHAHPLVATAEYLLHERIPWHAPLRAPLAPDGWRRAATLRTPRAEGWPVPRHPVVPQLHVLSNGRFSVWITAAGASGSRWRDRALTRWRPDPTVQGTGERLYVQDVSSGAFWTVGRDPVPEPGQHDTVRFAPHAVQFSRRRRGIGMKMEVTVPPADDLELRRVRLVNHAPRTRRVALVTYAEPVLAPVADDRRHPAFQKLFLETAWLPEHRALLVTRRLGSAADEPLYLLHALLYGPGVEGRVTFETDRARFLGRFGSARRPAALTAGALPLSCTTGATLDPVVALRCRVELAARAESELVFVTVAGRSRAEVLAPLERYRSAARVEWAFRQARTRSEQELQELGIQSQQAREMQELLSALLHPAHALRAEPGTLAANRLSRRGLWRHGISGDHPLLLVRVERAEDAPVAREALLAHAFWRGRRVEFDVVIVNDEPLGYARPLQERLEAMLVETEGDAWRDQRAGIFLLRGAGLEHGDRTLLASAAAVLLDASRGSLARQLERLREQPLELPGFVPMPSSPIELQPAIPWTRRSDLVADNGLGGFSADGREYVIELAGDRVTPAPWCNVIANPGFGFLVSESGGGFTWSAHSAENRLTPWRNDPVVDDPGEALYLRDEETGEIWSPTPQPMGRSAGASTPAGSPSSAASSGSSDASGSDPAYRVRHGAGYTVFEHHRHGLEQRLTLFAAREEPVKVVHLRVENRWSRHRRITATYYAEWVLGEAREDTLAHVVPDYDHAAGALLARNTYHATFDERVAFLAASREPHGLTTDRREFLGADGTVRRPAALSRIGLSGTVRPGTDPCAALQVHLDLAPGEAQEVHFLLGQGVDRDHATSLVSRFRDPAAVAAERERVDELWDGILDTVSVATPDRAMDLVLNRWLLYQALACRVWGRSALYQSSGAFGFRDQLQDVLALMHGAPHLARAHLLEAARHQFEEGDVLHWWHPPAGEGVRTRCSDDMLWLPYAVAAYVHAGGDAGVLDEAVPYLTAEPLRPDEKDRYTRFESGASGTLYEHCLRAIERGDTQGRHGLPLIGAHDWNDGLNRVGVEGAGESVWLAWFLRAVLLAFTPLAEARGDPARASAMRHRADALARAVEASAWDGRWYLRAWYDDGSPLGTSRDREARIDSLPQSWAVLAGGDPDRARTAMASLLEHLVRGDPALCCLFWPPFDRAPRDPGYVKGYPPGVRENGGQYAHAAAWVGWAFVQQGDGDRAHAVFDLLNPVRRAETPAEVELYRVEPYVMAADVYSHPPHVGRGGWTWYTGSAGWTWRLGVEAILGLRREGGGLRIDPCIPREWPGFQAVYRVGRSSWNVRVENPGRVSRGVLALTVNGAPVADGLVPLTDDGETHEVLVRMGETGTNGGLGPPITPPADHP